MTSILYLKKKKYFFKENLLFITKSKHLRVNFKVFFQIIFLQIVQIKSFFLYSNHPFLLLSNFNSIIVIQNFQLNI